MTNRSLVSISDDRLVSVTTYDNRSLVLMTTSDDRSLVSVTTYDNWSGFDDNQWPPVTGIGDNQWQPVTVINDNQWQPVTGIDDNQRQLVTAIDDNQWHPVTGFDDYQWQPVTGIDNNQWRILIWSVFSYLSRVSTTEIMLRKRQTLSITYRGKISKKTSIIRQWQLFSTKTMFCRWVKLTKITTYLQEFRKISKFSKIRDKMISQKSLTLYLYEGFLKSIMILIRFVNLRYYPFTGKRYTSPGHTYLAWKQANQNIISRFQRNSLDFLLPLQCKSWSGGGRGCTHRSSVGGGRGGGYLSFLPPFRLFQAVPGPTHDW